MGKTNIFSEEGQLSYREGWDYGKKPRIAAQLKPLSKVVQVDSGIADTNRVKTWYSSNVTLAEVMRKWQITSEDSARRLFSDKMVKKVYALFSRNADKIYTHIGADDSYAILELAPEGRYYMIFYDL